MKYLLLFGILVVVYLLWRHQRAQEGDPPPRAGAPEPGLPLEMVRCAHCTVHLPRTDALADAKGRLYCSAEHRQAADVK